MSSKIGEASPRNSEAVLEVKDLCIDFPSTTGDGWIRVLEDVSFTIFAGDSLALVGESGSGKTVTALAIMGLIDSMGGRIAGGKVIFEGKDLTASGPTIWRKARGPGMGMIFQQPTRSLNPAFTVGQQIGESLRLHKGMSRRQARARAIEMLDMVEIPHAADRLDEYPHAFSGGMSQRVMIAMAMAVEPRLLIADEPTTALDVTVQETVLKLLHDLQDETGVALLFVSHDLAVVAELCRRVAVMYAGQIVELGNIGDVYFSPLHPYTAGLLGAIPQGVQILGDRFDTIPGSIPAPGDWPPACRFSNRCEFSVKGRCDVYSPDLLPYGSHFARCLRVDEINLHGVEHP